MSVLGVVLAGGYSKRAECFKMTRKISGKPVIEYCIESMYEVCDKILVVTGYKSEKLRYLKEKFEKVSLVYNHNYNKGMFSSVVAGLGRVTEKRVFITPGDLPAVSAHTYKKMLKSTGEIVVPMYKKKCGHPVLMSKETALKVNENYLSLQDFIAKHGFKTVSVSDPGILADIDLPSDFSKIQKFLEEIW